MKALFDRNWIVRGLTIATVALFAAAAAPVQRANAWTFKVIHNFCADFDCADGADPGAGLLMDSAGNLYGTTESGPNGFTSGVAYELISNADHSRWKSKTLHKFCSKCGTDGSDPRAELVIDNAGNLYGTTAEGGPQNRGTAFELLPNGDRSKRIFKLLHTFSGGADGVGPVAALSYDGEASGTPYDGTSNLYGTTGFGGSNQCGDSCGVVFSLSPSGTQWTETPVYQFCNVTQCRDGGHPAAAPFVQGGIVFVTTSFGGNKFSRGTVLQLAGSSATVLHVFCEEHYCRDGGEPLGLTPDGSGALFGVGQVGGLYRKGCCGVVFKLVPNGADSQYTVLHDFCELRNCKDGALPSSNVLVDTSGNIYGATDLGGGHNANGVPSGGGTVYKLSGTSLETLHAFCAQHDCIDGANPIGNLAMDSAGNIFGVTQGGGKFGRGVVYEISP